MEDRFIRSRMLLGDEAMEKLKKARIAIFGIGGVGGYAAEALARTGVGSFVLVDADVVELSNINRQIVAATSTLGMAKVDVMRGRIFDINPDAEVEARRCFFLPENADEFDFSAFSYVIDAVDTVAAKVEIALRAQSAGVPEISCMGAGNRLDPSRFAVADIYETRGCPLAKAMRNACRKRGIAGLKTVYSDEPPLPASGRTPGSTAFAAPSAGLLLAAEAVRDLAL